MSGSDEQSNGFGFQPGHGRLASMDEADVPAPPHELVLVKKDQRYVFRCEPGDEASLLKQLRDLVEDPAVDLSWFDAAVLSHQVGEQLGQRLKRLGGFEAT